MPIALIDRACACFAQRLSDIRCDTALRRTYETGADRAWPLQRYLQTIVIGTIVCVDYVYMHTVKMLQAE